MENILLYEISDGVSTVANKVALCQLALFAVSPVASDPNYKFTLLGLFHLPHCREKPSACQAPTLMPSLRHKQTLFFFLSSARHMSGLAFSVSRVTREKRSSSWCGVFHRGWDSKCSEWDRFFQTQNSKDGYNVCLFPLIQSELQLGWILCLLSWLILVTNLCGGKQIKLLCH